jgi:hypothetical protein
MQQLVLIIQPQEDERGRQTTKIEAIANAIVTMERSGK